VIDGDCGPWTSSVNGFGIGQGGCVPATRLDSSYAVDSWSRFSPAQREVLHHAIADKLAPALDFTLRRLHLE
jgi:hypothetical protein